MMSSVLISIYSRDSNMTCVGAKVPTSVFADAHLCPPSIPLNIPLKIKINPGFLWLHWSWRYFRKSWKPLLWGFHGLPIWKYLSHPRWMPGFELPILCNCLVEVVLWLVPLRTRAQRFRKVRKKSVICAGAVWIWTFASLSSTRHWQFWQSTRRKNFHCIFSSL